MSNKEFLHHSQHKSSRLPFIQSCMSWLSLPLCTYTYEASAHFVTPCSAALITQICSICSWETSSNVPPGLLLSILKLPMVLSGTRWDLPALHFPTQLSRLEVSNHSSSEACQLCMGPASEQFRHPFTERDRYCRTGTVLSALQVTECSVFAAN